MSVLSHGGDAWHPERYDAPSAQGAEYQVADFLWGLVRLVQPNNVIELGTYHGDTTMMLANALKRNGVGMLTSVDINLDFVQKVRDYLKDSNFDGHARILEGSFDEVDLSVEGGYQVAYLDSFWMRDKEFEAVRPHLTPGAFVVMHDAGPHHTGARQRIAAVLTRRDVVGMYWPTPRGVVVAQYEPFAWTRV